MTQQNIVTIDGPAGVGKTTLARLIAAKLSWPYLDTGAMFRTLALQLPDDVEAITEALLNSLASKLHFSLRGTGELTQLLCNDRAIGQEIRTEEVGLKASRLAVNASIRTLLANFQREIANLTPLVAEGRDMGN